MLTDTKLRNLKPADKLYKVNDRDGLYVAVTPAGICGELTLSELSSKHGVHQAMMA